jgi:predicted unusual protein kinase regulating ubiquinone biosynthesis (AarF/ABC1/UbiB family)
MAKKKLKNLRTGSLTRGFSIAKLGLQIGAKAAERAIGDFFGDEAAQIVRKKAERVGQMAMIAKELGELKGSLMKAGQMLSVYGEFFLPPEANQLLKTLQSDSPAVEWQEMRKVLVRQLGKEKIELLEIEQEALAAASMGQVHRARIKKSGEEIVLKIQYPGVDKAIDGDLKALRKVLGLMEWLPKLPATDTLFEEVRMMMRQELDYEQERNQLDFFRGKLAGDSRYIVPKSYPEFSSKRVLAMSYEPGASIDGVEVAALSQQRRNELAKNALDLYFRELFVWKRVQTDPHFGNFRARLNPDCLVLYDFGATREVPSAFLESYRQMLRGLFYADRKAFEKAAISLGVLEPTDPEELKDLFHELCSSIVEPFAKEGEYDWKQNDLPSRVTKITWEIFKRFPLRSPPREVVFLDRKMGGIFTFLSVLGAKFDARSVLKPHME